jgi:uncharacterized membrane protein YjgN (DUF898 family)
VPQPPIPFVFSGSASEYFRIWAVNTALSIVTLGVYSAWAKVRRMRYFYAHTTVDGSGFGYHASPVAILKGRLFMAAVFAALVGTQALSPVLGQVVSLLFAVASPALLVRAVLFRNANTSYRGVRFGFTGTWSDAWSAYVWPGALAMFTLGLGAPYAFFKTREFLVQNATYGSARFQLLADWTSFYPMFWRSLLLFFGALIPAFAILMASFLLLASTDPALAAAIISYEILILLAACGGIAYTHFRTAATNLVWNTTLLGDHRFVSSLRTREMLSIYVVNIVAIIATIGLAIPWARIRLAKYCAEHLTLVPDGPLESFVAGEIDQAPAAASELADAFGFDLGI